MAQGTVGEAAALAGGNAKSQPLLHHCMIFRADLYICIQQQNISSNICNSLPCTMGSG